MLIQVIGDDNIIQHKLKQAIDRFQVILIIYDKNVYVHHLHRAVHTS